jgi:hypothetical protein
MMCTAACKHDAHCSRLSKVSTTSISRGIAPAGGGTGIARVCSFAAAATGFEYLSSSCNRFSAALFPVYCSWHLFRKIVYQEVLRTDCIDNELRRKR